MTTCAFFLMISDVKKTLKQELETLVLKKRYGTLLQYTFSSERKSTLIFIE